MGERVFHEVRVFIYECVWFTDIYIYLYIYIEKNCLRDCDGELGEGK